MTIPIIHLLIICLFVPLTASQSCYFDFEDDSELQNFNQVCNGALGSWQIDDRPEKPPPPSGTGDRVLVNKVQETSCMQSLNQIEVQEDQEVTINLFLKKPAYSDNYSLEISLTCSSSTVEKWSVLTGYEEPNGDGEWIQKTHLFHNSAPDLKCTIGIVMYRNGGAEVAIDKLTIVDPVSADECYAVPKATTTIQPESTTDATTESTTDATTESTTVPTTESTNPTTESTTDPTTESTTDPTTESTTDPTTESTTDPTTESTTDPTTDNQTTESTTTQPTEETTTNNPSETSTTSGPTSVDTTAEPPSTTVTTTREPPEDPEGSGYEDFSIFYMVIIIAVSGGFALLSAAICCCIIRLGRPKKNSHKKLRWLS